MRIHQYKKSIKELKSKHVKEDKGDEEEDLHGEDAREC